MSRAPAVAMRDKGNTPPVVESIDNKKAQAAFDQARALYKSKAYRNAVRKLDEAIKLNPGGRIGAIRRDRQHYRRHYFPKTHTAAPSGSAGSVRWFRRSGRSNWC